MNSNPPIDSLPDSTSNSPAQPTRCGYVALVGRPNVGKSTLFNAFIGQRLSIVTPKPQTTRGRILGILTKPQSQIIFLDTPGLLESQYKLHRTMEKQISTAARDADLILLLIDAERPRDRSKLVHAFLRQARAPVVAALNKIDLLSLTRVKEESAAIKDEFGLESLMPLSALRGDSVKDLLNHLETRLPLGVKLYPDDMIAEQPERFFAAELVREAAFNNLSDELPYAINVAIDEFSQRNSKTYIHATIYVERDSQKGIVIGNKGERLRTIGHQARLTIEEFIDAQVYLDLWVKVRPDWRNHDRDLNEFGYQ